MIKLSRRNFCINIVASAFEQRRVYAGDVAFKPASNYERPFWNLGTGIAATEYQWLHADRSFIGLIHRYVAVKDVWSDSHGLKKEILIKRLKSSSGANVTNILRPYLIYPGLDNGWPDDWNSRGWIKKIHVSPMYSAGRVIDHVYVPDFNNCEVAARIIEFSNEFFSWAGQDSSIIHVELGLVGYWGEWHFHPHQYLMPSIGIQEKIISAASEGCKKKLLCRFPAGKKHKFLASTVDYVGGYHDDSIGWQSLRGQRPGSFEERLIDVYGSVHNFLRSGILCGEVRPEISGEVYKKNGNENINFLQCLEKFNYSWIRDTYSFWNKKDKNFDIIKLAASQIGYDLYIYCKSLVSLDGLTKISFIASNMKSSPIPAEFEIMLGFLSVNDNLLKKIPIVCTSGSFYLLSKISGPVDLSVSFLTKEIPKNSIICCAVGIGENNVKLTPMSNQVFFNDWLIIGKAE